MNIFNLDTNIRISTAVNVNLSANQWDLHVESFPRYTVEQVATFLNKRFNTGYNRGMKKKELIAHMEDLMEQFSVYGATERETRKVLTKLLEQVYP